MKTDRYRTSGETLNEFSLDVAPHHPALPIPVTGPPSSLRTRRTVRGGGEVLLTALGPVRVTNRRVYTPAVTLPLHEVRWRVEHRFTWTEETPEWATVASLVGVPFTLGLSLLLLMVKESHLRGHVKVTIKHPAGRYTMRLPVTSVTQVGQIHQAVAYVGQWSRRRSRSGHTMAA
ncbi:hypothetical protein [Phytomonospora endophytica]|uniref:Uncharacterized protein n=1 Tax=Phytomonospora endophytica TaxID=714109 RepID=A0A841FL60_9ACTN|nr:hypothetical protein [Phytomonospora endophytica]MBB6038071.1 hypothetical protein [Phytomonospora endophytica]GIG67465.1 hypothetical protein Pen01_37600 [Phytomonospora endophytica]